MGYKRVPFSGGVWPYLEDLVRERIVSFKDKGGGGRETMKVRHLAQVKTTESDAFLKEWLKLEEHAQTENAVPHWYTVVKTPQQAYIFETRLAKVILLGIGGGNNGRE
jgi:hypothetical protein